MFDLSKAISKIKTIFVNFVVNKLNKKRNGEYVFTNTFLSLLIQILDIRNFSPIICFKHRTIGFKSV